MNSDNQISFRKVRPEESGLIARFQVDMAKETEDKQLSLDNVQKAVEFMNEHPNHGFYLVGVTKQDLAISTELITFEHDIFRSTNLWWFQSVFVEKEFRGKGVFKNMFKEIERLNKEQSFPLRLYVENENKRAQQVYKGLGMFDTNEIFIEDDFYFDDQTNFSDSKIFKFNLAEKEELKQFKLNLAKGNLISLMDKQINQLDKTMQSIHFIEVEKEFGGVFVISQVQTDEVIGYLFVFYEYSDWRNGNMIYIYDLRIVDQFQDKIDKIELISSFMHYLKKIFIPSIVITNIRWIIQEKAPFKDNLLSAGLQEAHYRVYEKNIF